MKSSKGFDLDLQIKKSSESKVVKAGDDGIYRPTKSQWYPGRGTALCCM
ncbi:hypothetical protein [Thermoflavimicrobium daqui]|nr:hypothetical protein [Thermoflavimicrobium daqui]